MTKIADDCLAIKTRMEEIAAERAANIMGKPLEDAQPTEAPKDIDWTGMYGYPTGLTIPDITEKALELYYAQRFKDFIG